MKHTQVATVVRRHVRLHAAQRILEAYDAGEPFAETLHSLTPEMRRAVEGLLRATAEAWGNAVTQQEQHENRDAHWLW
jgi:hypothetical protein